MPIRYYALSDGRLHAEPSHARRPSLMSESQEVWTMGRLSACALVALLLPAAQASAADTPVAEVSQLRLYSSFWQNLHHFLYVSAWATRKVAPGRSLAMPLPPDSNVSMTADERATWDHAIAVYEREF